MTDDELKTILVEHDRWLRGDGGKCAELSEANLSEADLSEANLSMADRKRANLLEADLLEADLREANLREANLSGSGGLLSAIDWMAEMEQSADGWIVYKCIGKTQFPAPESWRVEPGAILSEVANPDRTCDCACGVNFGTRAWCDANYTDAVLWRCLIRWEWGPGVVVPYNTDGKARCERLQLVEVVND
jgi:uncharacterized protein YjbI with pentapeptide repeats